MADTRRQREQAADFEMQEGATASCAPSQTHNAAITSQRSLEPPERGSVNLAIAGHSQSSPGNARFPLGLLSPLYMTSDWPIRQPITTDDLRDIATDAKPGEDLDWTREADPKKCKAKRECIADRKREHERRLKDDEDARKLQEFEQERKLKEWQDDRWPAADGLRKSIGGIPGTYTCKPS